MELFLNRFDDKYITDLLSHISIEGENGLINKAIEIKEPFKHEGRVYSKIARIDFIGLSATTLFDIGNNFTSNTIPDKIEEILKNLDKLNEQGVFLKIRVLFIYPYSDFALSLIQAETSRKRASIEEPEFIRDFKFVEEVDEKRFFGSLTFRNQQNSLAQIENLINKHNLYGDNPNTIKIRFTPSPISTCMLIINNTGYYDSYLMAKEKRNSNKLSFLNPIQKLSKTTCPKGFSAYEDHFRYLWTLDTTLYCDDATNFNFDKGTGLTEVLPPDKINFDNKASRIIHRLKRTKPDFQYSVDEINQWKFRLSHLVSQSTQSTRTSPNQETLFITCSWQEDERKKKYLPNTYAKKISKWLNRDFGIDSENQTLKVNIMEAAVGSFLFQQLYKTLNDTTLAVIIMTKDIKSEEGIFYCKPNVYHELGFLMKHLSNSTRLAVLLEEGVYEPSNIKSLIRIEFNKKNFDEKYSDLLDWVENSSTFINNSYIQSARNNQKLKDD